MDKGYMSRPREFDLASQVRRKAEAVAHQQRRVDRDSELTLDETGLSQLLQLCNRAQRQTIISRLQSTHGNEVVQRLLTHPQRNAGAPVARARGGRTVQRIAPAAVVGAIELGTAIFSAGSPLILSGNFSSEAATLNYLHERTPADARWKRATTSFTLYAFHPRLGFGNQHFEFRVSFEYNEYDLRDVTVLGLQSASSEMTSSSFQIRFNGLAHSAPSERVAAIRYQISGVWNPVGRGIDTFWGTLEIDATGRGSLQVSSERAWVWAGDWGARTDQQLAAPPAPPLPTLHLHLITFRPSRDKITEEGERSLIAWYDRLPPGAREEIEAGRLQISVEGHASTTQPGPANRLLSRRRAQKVREILADIAGSNAVFNVRAVGEYRAGTPDQVEDESERIVVVSVAYADSAKAASGGPSGAGGGSTSGP